MFLKIIVKSKDKSLDFNLTLLFKNKLLDKNRLTVESGFGSNYWNRLDSTISILEIDSKPKSIYIILKSIRFDSSRYSIPILEIESNC